MADAAPDAVAPSPLFPLRTVVLGALLPSLLFGVATGVLLPLIPTTATRLGADLATAGFLTALLPIGKALADVPAGALASRIGDVDAMVVASALGLLGLVAVASASSLWVLGAGIWTLGSATAVFHLARHAYLTEITPVAHRARVLSTLGGMHRLGYFVGPFIGALVVLGSSLRPAYWLATACLGVGLAVLLAVRPRRGRRRGAASPAAPVRLRTTIADHRRLLLTLGTASLLVGAVRGARQAVLPLWGESLGLEPSVISVVFGLSAAIDVVLFYPAGKVMDAWGRLWIALPSMLVMGVAMALLPLTGSATTMVPVALLLGLGNGLGAGIMMTIGADVAPAEGRATFLGVWRLFQDTGDACGPLVIAAGTLLGSLAGGIWLAALFGVGSAAALTRWVPRYSVHANRTTRSRAGLG